MILLLVLANLSPQFFLGSNLVVTNMKHKVIALDEVFNINCSISLNIKIDWN